MNRVFALAIAAAAAFSATAYAAPQLERVRGTIESVAQGSVGVRSAAGHEIKVALAPDTKYALVTKSDLSHIKPGTFIGTATKGRAGSMVALEVVVFPESMRGTAEGYYPWDRLADPTKSGTPMVTSNMTNGNVDNSGPATETRKVRSAMTNGTVESSGGQSGGLAITVSYAGGKQRIVVPPHAPIVAFEPSDRSILVQGGKIFIVAAKENGQLTAKLVGVGQSGLKPPM